MLFNVCKFYSSLFFKYIDTPWPILILLPKLDKRRKEERYEEKVGRKGATKKKERMKEWQRKNDKERMTKKEWQRKNDR